MTRIDESSEADAREQARLTGGDVAEEMRDDALRQVVGFDAVGDRQLLQLGRQTPVAADDPADEAFVAEVIETAVLAIALTGGVGQGQIARAAGRRLRIFTEKALLESDRDIFRETDTDETAGGERVAISDQADCFGGSNDLVALASRLRGIGWQGHKKFSSGHEWPQ